MLSFDSNVKLVRTVAQTEFLAKSKTSTPSLKISKPNWHHGK